VNMSFTSWWSCRSLAMMPLSAASAMIHSSLVA
jgi:hypothetical protein